MGLTDMWRCGFCLVALLAAPALAQTLPNDDSDSALSPQHRTVGHHSLGHRAAGYRTEGRRRVRRGPGSLSSLAMEPSHLGPAPMGFWYRCDSPSGYYPYIPVCRTPWRIVPSVPPR